MNKLKLDYKKTIYIGLAFFLITMFWQTYDSLIAKILIDKFGLNQSNSGIIMALDNVLALFMLPLFGLLSDRTRSKLGKRTPYIIVGTLVAALAFVSLSFVDAKQTQLVADAGIITEYEKAYGDVISIGGSIEDTKLGWKLIFDDINSTGNYDETYLEYTKKLEEHENGIIRDKFLNQEISDVYYNYLSLRAADITKKNTSNLIWFIAILMVCLIAMSTFRSPAVALMPDVTLKPLRSKANAVINLLGSAGAVVSIGILSVLGLSKKSYVNYWGAFVATGVIMIVLLIIFLIKVKEPKLIEEYEELLKIHGEEEVVEEDATEKKGLSKGQKTSLFLILFSVFFWYMGYNAVITKLSDYAPKQLNMDFALPLLVAQAAAIVAFIPIGILSSKIGRKKMILVGVVLLAASFFGASFLTETSGPFLFVILAIVGIAWATINVNSFPMAVELATGDDIGKYTGYYYAFSMAAQIITPILSGVFMDSIGRKALFPYAAICVAVSFLTMLFVKHGDVKVERKGLLESFDVED